MYPKSNFTSRTILKFVHKLIYLTAAAVSALSIASIFGRYPYLELFTHFRLQYAWLSIICIIGLSVFHSWKLALLVTACAFFNLSHITPYYFAAERPVQNVPTLNLRLLLANVEGNNKDYPALMQSVTSANADIVILQEVTQKWWENVQILSSDYAYFKAVPRSGGAGLAIFSKYPIEESNILSLDSSTHPALFCKIKLEDTQLSLLTIHPPTPMNPIKFANRNEQFAQAAAIMKTADEPKLLIGDLNTTMWSPYFTDLLKNSGLRDARIGKGLYPSWNTWLPTLLRIPIDQCLVSEKIEVNTIGTGSNTGSDHLPLIVNLKIEKQIIQENQ